MIDHPKVKYKWKYIFLFQIKQHTFSLYWLGPWIWQGWVCREGQMGAVWVESRNHEEKLHEDMWILCQPRRHKAKWDCHLSFRFQHHMGFEDHAFSTYTLFLDSQWCCLKNIGHLLALIIQWNYHLHSANGNWGSWGEWTRSASNPASIVYRRKKCDNPAPTSGGLTCDGDDLQVLNPGGFPNHQLINIIP